MSTEYHGKRDGPRVGMTGLWRRQHPRACAWFRRSFVQCKKSVTVVVPHLLQTRPIIINDTCSCLTSILTPRTEPEVTACRLSRDIGLCRNKCGIC